MDMSKTFELSLSYEITSENEEWRNVLDYGMDAPEVTGGMIKLPQGGTRKSAAAIVGGIFLAGSEAGSMAEENTRKIIDAIVPSELQDRITELISNSAGVIADLELFATNIAKSEYQKIAGEYSDNENEKEATEKTIDSIQVKITITGIPTEEDIYDWVNVQATKFLEHALTGGEAS